jgi:D-alanyl-D-alanine carboxypeptidase/D-alanyl-D-alanine-endopeptidase (penicillin-binding protein 4)
MIFKKYSTFCIAIFVITLQSCSISSKIGKQASRFLLNDSSLSKAHIGIAVQDIDNKAWIYQYQSDKLFTPASNTKIVSCYAAMKHLSANLPAAFISDLDTAVLLTPTGDPRLLEESQQTYLY